ncbi:MAG: CcmD family protein [Bacteroidota bacterium]
MNGLYSLLNANELYIVLLIALVVWGGIFSYLYRLDKKVKDLENLLKKK